MIRTGMLALVLIFHLSGDFNKEIPEWEIEAPNYIHWIFPTITGNLLYKGTDGIHGLDPETRE
uniref:hypothetical protein n=1 Tax=Aquiflexum sp. TaxID=1872584 RepID=UPI0035943A80